MDLDLAARGGGHRRGLPDLLGGGVLHCPPRVRLQSRIGGAARLRHLDLRRVGGDRRRRSHPGASARPGHGVFAGRHLRGRGGAHFAVLGETFLWQEPLVAGAWMGLAIKTDGAAVAGGGITESLILAKSAAEGIRYQPGWILGVTATVKVFIEIFIGIWAFVLGYIWTNHINPTRDEDKARASEIWQRFPK
jgi:hypothetical protein